MSDPFDQIGNAEVWDQSAYIEPGVYPVVWIERMLMNDTRKGKMFIVELHVIEGAPSNSPEANKAGTECAYFANMAKDSGPSNARRVLAQCAGIDAKSVDRDGAKLAVSDANPYRGTLVAMRAHLTKTKAGNPFTVVNFERLPDNVQAQAVALHEAAGWSNTPDPDADIPF